MSGTFEQIKLLAASDKIRVSQNAFRRLAAHSIVSDDLIASLAGAIVIEDYPAYHLGPAVLVLQFNTDGAPLHAVWGIERDTGGPAVLVTAYRPDPARWLADFRTRRP